MTSVAAGTVVTLTATVVSGSTPVNPGQVKFCDASAAHCEDSALLADGAVDQRRNTTFKFRPGSEATATRRSLSAQKGYAMSSSTKASLTVTGRDFRRGYIRLNHDCFVRFDRQLHADRDGGGRREFSLSLTGDVSFLNTTSRQCIAG